MGPTVKTLETAGSMGSSPENRCSPMEWESDHEEGELTDSDPEVDSHRTVLAQKFLPESQNDDVVVEEGRIDDDTSRLYRSLNVITEDAIRHSRFDTIHVRGTEKMKTNDIFEYFSTPKPLFLEWIDENSCNVVWKDDVSAARAMISYSKPIKGIDHDEDVESDAIHISDIPVPVPAGHWRVGARHPKSEFLFLRFANKSDRKIDESEKPEVISKKYDISDEEEPETGKISESMKSRIRSVQDRANRADDKSKNPWGELCRSWGINDSQEVFSDRNDPVTECTKRKSVRERIGAVPIGPRTNATDDRTSAIRRLGKRIATERIDDVENERDESESDEDWKTKSKVPRMRMHADDEEEKIARIETASKLALKSKRDAITVQIKNERSSDCDSDGPRSGRMSPDAEDAHGDDDLKSNVYARLGKRFNESDDEKFASKLKSDQMNEIHSKNTSTVWSRLDLSGSRKRIDSEDDSENENPTDLRRALGRSKIKSTVSEKCDLRDRIQRKKGDQRIPLRIEVTNELYSEKI